MTQFVFFQVWLAIYSWREAVNKARAPVSGGWLWWHTRLSFLCLCLERSFMEMWLWGSITSPTLVVGQAAQSSMKWKRYSLSAKAVAFKSSRLLEVLNYNWKNCLGGLGFLELPKCAIHRFIILGPSSLFVCLCLSNLFTSHHLQGDNMDCDTYAAASCSLIKLSHQKNHICNFFCFALYSLQWNEKE